MAMIKCPECGKEISDQAKACPYCGRPSDAAQKAEEQHDKASSLTGCGCLLTIFVTIPIILMFMLMF